MSTFTKAYLVLYNSSLVIAWSMVLLQASRHVSETKSVEGLYGQVSFWLKIAQTAAIMEILHSAFGLVKSSVATVFPQIFSRIAILWIVLETFVMQSADTENTIGFPLLLFAWTVTEIIRYSFYTNTLLETVPFALTWCRYTFFIILYPMGVAGEVISLWASIPQMEESGLLDIKLPNPANFGLSFAYLGYFCLVIYPFGLYYLYTYMLSQRKKVLAAEKKKDE